jgi:hypothetical protein
MAIEKYLNIFHSKALQNLPKSFFFVWKYTLWQPWKQTDGVCFKNRRNFNCGTRKCAGKRNVKWCRELLSETLLS